MRWLTDGSTRPALALILALVPLGRLFVSSTPDRLSRDEPRYVLDSLDVMGPGYLSETFRVLKK